MKSIRFLLLLRQMEYVLIAFDVALCECYYLNKFSN